MTETSTKASRKGFKRYNMWYTTSRLNTTLHRGSKTTPALWYLQTNLINPAKPSIRLRRGATRKSPVCYFGRARYTSMHGFRVARGDSDSPAGKQAASYEAASFRREHGFWRRSDYELCTTVRSSDEDGTKKQQGEEEELRLRWRKDKTKWLSTVYDCVDENNGGRVVARMASGGGFNYNKAGEIDVVDGLSDEAEGWILFTAGGIWGVEALYYNSLLQGYDSEH